MLPGGPANKPRKNIRNPYSEKIQRPAQSDPPAIRDAIFGHFAPRSPRNLNPHWRRVQTVDWAPWDPQTWKFR